MPAAQRSGTGPDLATSSPWRTRRWTGPSPVSSPHCRWSVSRRRSGRPGTACCDRATLPVLHHVTYSINSICHVFGRRSFATADESRNVFWLALPSFGESSHNNHHAFPTSAVHGLGRRQLDPAALLIGALERCGLAWDVVRVSPERLSSPR